MFGRGKEGKVKGMSKSRSTNKLIFQQIYYFDRNIVPDYFENTWIIEGSYYVYYSL